MTGQSTLSDKSSPSLFSTRAFLASSCCLISFYESLQSRVLSSISSFVQHLELWPSEHLVSRSGQKCVGMRSTVSSTSGFSHTSFSDAVAGLPFVVEPDSALNFLICFPQFVQKTAASFTLIPQYLQYMVALFLYS